MEIGIIESGFQAEGRIMPEQVSSEASLNITKLDEDAKQTR